MSDDTRQRVVLFTEDDPLILTNGVQLGPVDVVYETWGSLNADASNAVFIPHALTGDSHAHGTPERPGWWDTMIGPGKPIDTDQFFVICPNLLGGCQGTTGPRSINPRTGTAYGLDFPLLQVRDFVLVHRALLRHLGISRLHALVGGSLGGMQGLAWSLEWPEEIDRSVWIAATAALSAQNLAFSAVGRAAITGDPEFRDGNYTDEAGPRLGLRVARMLAHITYLSHAGMAERFGREFQYGDARQTMGIDFAVESYLDHQGHSFLERFDALSYLYLSRSLDYFDPLSAPHALDRIARAELAHEILLISFDSDWRFGFDHSDRMRAALATAGVPVRHHEVSAPYGHDSFLMDIPEYHDVVRQHLRT